MMAMYLDFSSILAIATVVTGAIWATDAMFFKRRRLATAGASAPEPKLVEYSRSFFPILLVVCLLRSFVVEPFRIPTGSMQPTLKEGDFILVNKYIYGMRLPVFGNKFFHIASPKKGDILIFRFPNDTTVDYVKRVIGVPGDKISYTADKKLVINGEPVTQEFMGNAQSMDNLGRSFQVQLFKEKLPDDKIHDIYLYPFAPGVAMQEREIPPGHYFVMGDNRDNSEDSRKWGFVPENLILGKAIFIWMSWDASAKDVRWHRIGTTIKD